MWQRLANWCVPTRVYANWGTLGDNLALVIVRTPLTDRQVAWLEARWLEMNRTGKPTPL